MENIEKVKETEIFYKAKNGKEFRCLKDCEVYEKYYPLNIYEVTKDYIKYLCNEEQLKNFKNNNPTYNVYAMLIKEIPEDVVRYIDIIGDCKLNYTYTEFLDNGKIDEPILFCSVWDDYRGKHWENIGTIKYLKYQQEKIQKEIKLFNLI